MALADAASLYAPRRNPAQGIMNAPSPLREQAGILEAMAGNFSQGGMTPATALMQGVLKGTAASKNEKAAAEEDVQLKRMQALYEAQMQQAQYMDAIKARGDELKLSTLERAERQASIDEALSMAEQFGDMTAINKVLDAMPGTKAIIARDLPEGAALTGAALVNGHLLPVGTMPDGRQVFGQDGLPIGRMYSPERQAENLRLRGEELTNRKLESDIAERGKKSGSSSRDVAGGDAKPDASGKPLPKLTEAQGKNTNFGIRMSGAMDKLNSLEGKAGFDPANLTENLAKQVPLVGNYGLSDDFQQYQQAQREYLAGILRGDTGAAITNEEFALYGPMYFPQPGDGAEVVKQKREARKRAFDGTKVVAGPGAKAIPEPGDINVLKEKYGLE